MQRICAWYNRSEWCSVYEDLFSGNPLLQRHGLDKIAVWKCRVLHRLSTAIECSSELVRSDLLDKQYAEDNSRLQEVRLTMAMALTRFVNLITEKYQKEEYAQSVHRMAQKVGLPEWLVDLRHDATHSSLPSIHVLRTALQSAIMWLKINYWEAQLLGEEGDVHQQDQYDQHRQLPLSEDIAKYKAECLLERYLQLNLKAFKQKKKEQAKVDLSLTRATLDEIEKLCNTNRDDVLKISVQDGFVTPTKDQLHLLDVDTKALHDCEDLQLPQEVITIWRPLLKIFHQRKRTNMLLQLFCDELSEGNNLRNRLLCGWLDMIVSNAREPDAYRRSIRLYNQEFDVNHKSLVEQVISKPSKYTLMLIISLFAHHDCGFSDIQKDHLIDCLCQYTEHGTDTTEEEGIYTLKDCKHDAVLDKETSIDPSTSRANWVLCQDEIDWSKLPLGNCPGVTIDYHNLELVQIDGDEAAHIDRNNTPECKEVVMDTVDMDKTEHCIDDKEGRLTWTESEIKTIAECVSLF